MAKFDHFGFLAPVYDRILRRKGPEKLVDLLDLPIAGALLDAGGGTGRVAQSLNGYAKPIVIADVSHGMLQQAKNKDGLSAVCSQSEELPFADHSFERVIMVDAFHHVINHSHTTRELWRVLQPGGLLVIEEPDIRIFSVKIIALFEKLVLMRSHFVSPKQIQAMFSHSKARTRLEREGMNAWVIIEKLY